MPDFKNYLAQRQGDAAVARGATGTGDAFSALDRPLRITFFGNHAAKTKEEERVSLRAMLPRLRDTRAPDKDTLPWCKLATFGTQRSRYGSLRNNGNVLEIEGVEGDCDCEQITLDRARQILQQANLAAVLYTSPSHTPAKPRWRVLCPTSAALPPDRRAGLVARLQGLFVGALAEESFTLSQSYFFGAIAGAGAHEVVTVEGRFIDQADEMDREAIGRRKPSDSEAEPVAAAAPAWAGQAARSRTEGGGTAYGLVALDRECNAIRAAGEGSKHATLNRAAYAIGGLVTSGDLEERVASGGLRDALRDIRDRCKDFRAAERTLESAFASGMEKPRVGSQAPVEAVDPAAGFIAKARAKVAAVQSKPLPITPDLLDAGGALGLFVDHCNRTAISPQPFLALAAGICAIGALAGRRYRTRTDLRTNIYAVGIADSGGGKDHARKQIKAVFGRAGLTRYLGGEDIASGAAMLTALYRHPAILFQIDEFGDWLGGVLGKQASPHKRQVAERLKTLYSSADSFIAGTEYANQGREGRPREDIQQPHACLYGTTTPGQFWQAIAGGSMHDGLLARVLMFVTDQSYPDESDPTIREPSDELVAAFRRIAEGAEAAPAGNMGGIMSGAVAAEPHLVQATPEAERAIKALRRDQLTLQRQAEGTYVTAIAARWAENAVKLALVRAVSRDPARPSMQAADVAWGRALAKHCIDTLLQDADRHVAENEFETRMNKVREIIRKHGPATERDLIRRGLKLSSRDRADVLRTLTDAGAVIALPSEHTGAGRPTIRYALGDTIQFGTGSEELSD